MIRVWAIVGFVALVFWVFAIVDVSVQHPSRHRGVSKPVWVLLVVLIPVLGGLLWFVVGRTRKSTAATRNAPDDDPEFLGRLGSISDQDERIRRLEEELAQLDAEADDPRWASPSSEASGATTDAPPPSDSTGVTPENPPLGTDRPDDDDTTRGQRGAVG